MSRIRVKENSGKISRRNQRIRLVRRILIVMLAFLLLIYFVLRIVYETGKFTIVLDAAGNPMSSIVIYENLDEKRARQKLSAEAMDFITNISVDWLPTDIGNAPGGSHNGENYIAYTFYIENQGDDTINYWYEMMLDDVIKNVDEALRVMIILNDEKTIYGKLNGRTNQPEKTTVAFRTKEEILSGEENKIIIEGRKDFKSKEIDKMTVVIWIEGDDPDCIDDLIGGEIKMHMKITEEQIQQ